MEFSLPPRGERLAAARSWSAPKIASAVVAVALLAAATPTRAPAADASAFRVGPGDELEIQVFEDDTFNVVRRVSGDGTITLPLVGEIAVGEQTVTEIATILESVLERSYLQRATVDVNVSDYRSKPISVIGAVRSPGTLYMDGNWNLFQAIAAAGGLAPESGGAAVILRRSSDEQLVDQLTIDLDDLFERGDQIQNVALYANDVINVQGTTEITVYFLGEVKTQGAVMLRGSDATLLTAVARAGGLSERASNRVLIKRDTGGGQRLEIAANFQRILAGSEPDVELREGDLIVVKESFL